MLKYILFCLFVNAWCTDAEYIINELPCTVSGGTCMKASDCPLRPEHLRSYCPTQHSKGVVCCHGISNSKTTCRERAGECMKGCPTRLVERTATDCKDNETCCVLVK